jgi:hypothetical protein
VNNPPEVLFHATATVNRESITTHGLDVTRMTVAGIAGSPTPEDKGVYLAETLWDGFWYASFRQHALVDIWAANVSGLRLREVNEGWICKELITPDRLNLVEANVSPDDADAWLNAQRQEEPNRAARAAI